MGKEPEPIRTVEDVAIREPDKSGWAALCGKYEQQDKEFFVEEVFLRDCALFARITENGCTWEPQLYPLSEKEFGIKRYTLKFRFDEGALHYVDCTCKKL